MSEFAQDYDQKTRLLAEIRNLEACLAERDQALADLSRLVGEQNTTIGYQDAMLTEMQSALSAAEHALLSYAHGNSAPGLALSVAELIESTVKVRTE